MAAKVYEATLSRELRAPRAMVWALVADTNRWDRCSGLTPGTYRWEEVEGRRVRAASARELGFAIDWIEPPYQWVEGRFVLGERTFREGPVEAGGLRVRLEDLPDGGTRATATAYVHAGGALGAVLGAVMKGRFRRALKRYFDAIGQVLAEVKPADAAADEPAVVRVQRALMGSYDPTTSGPRSDTDEIELGRRAERLRAMPVDPGVSDRLTRHLRDRPDEEVAQIRPFELAHAWQVDKREVLRGFLHATRAGLVDLRWQINCPVCRVAAGVADRLDTVGNDIHCGACNIRYDVDFGAHVEAVFQCNPAIRRTHTAVFCASSPSFLPHVLGQLEALPGKTVTEVADLPIGTLHVRTLGSQPAADLEVAGVPALVKIAVGDDRIAASVESRPAGSDSTIEVTSTASRPHTVLFERGGWNAAAVTGALIATFPDFLDLFATEAPAAGLDLSIGHLTLLFSDLTGSTALYERVGDARAFAIVEEHFRSMEEIIVAHEGALIKTMGDACMATFPSPVLGVKAAIAMCQSNHEEHGELGLGVKLGVHAGPCLAVRANERIDFFGTTVNVAARLQAQAKSGEVVVMAETAEHPQIAPLLAPFTQRRFEAALKGIAQAQQLVGARVAG